MDIRKYIYNPNPIIVEIGANVGMDTLRFLDYFPDARIYAIEPDPNAYLELLTRCNQYPNINIYQLAISNKCGRIDFYPSSQALSGSIRKPKEHLTIYPQVTFSEPISVMTETLDSFVELEEINEIDFLWADVQGAEIDMILGGEKTFPKKVKYLLTEFSKKELYEGAPNLNTILEFLPDFQLVEIPWEWEADGNALLKNINYGI